MSSSSATAVDVGAGALEPAVGLGVLVRPRPAAAAGCRSAGARRAGRRSCMPALDRVAPAVELTAARAAGELLDARRARAWSAGRARAAATSERVGHEAAGRGVDLAGVVVAGRPQLAGDGEVARLRRPWMPDSRRHGSWRTDGLALEHRLELLRGDLASCRRSSSSSADRVAHVEQQLDVERGVDEPGLRQRPGRPVGGGVLLREVDAEQLLDDGAEADAGEAGEPGAELGVEDARRVEADLAQAGEVLARGVQDPLLVADRRRASSVNGSPIGGRIEQEDAGAAAEDLDQVGALRVPEAGCALGVDRDRAGARGDRRDGGAVVVDGLDDVERRVRGRFDGAGAAVPSSASVTRRSEMREQADGLRGRRQPGEQAEQLAPALDVRRRSSRRRGVHDARSSSCAPSPCPASSPKPVESILVAVPEAAV